MPAPVISLPARRAQQARTQAEAERFVRHVERASVTYADPLPAPDRALTAIERAALSDADLAAAIEATRPEAVRHADLVREQAERARRAEQLAHLASLHGAAPSGPKAGG